MSNEQREANYRQAVRDLMTTQDDREYRRLLVAVSGLQIAMEAEGQDWYGMMQDERRKAAEGDSNGYYIAPEVKRLNGRIVT